MCNAARRRSGLIAYCHTTPSATVKLRKSHKKARQQQLTIVLRLISLSLPSPPPVEVEETTGQQVRPFTCIFLGLRSIKEQHETANTCLGKPPAGRLHAGLRTLLQSFGDWSPPRYSQDNNTLQILVGGLSSPLPSVQRFTQGACTPALVLFHPSDFDNH